MTMNDSCTLYEAIALLAGMGETAAKRYGAPAGVKDSGKQKYRLDALYHPCRRCRGTEALYQTLSIDETEAPAKIPVLKAGDFVPFVPLAGGPSASLLLGHFATAKSSHGSNKPEFNVGRQQHAADAGQSMIAGRARLDAAVQTGAVAAYGSEGRIPQEFWLTHNVSSAEAQSFRWRRGDLTRLMDPAFVTGEVFGANGEATKLPTRLVAVSANRKSNGLNYEAKDGPLLEAMRLKISHRRSALIGECSPSGSWSRLWRQEPMKAKSNGLPNAFARNSAHKQRTRLLRFARTVERVSRSTSPRSQWRRRNLHQKCSFFYEKGAAGTIPSI